MGRCAPRAPMAGSKKRIPASTLLREEGSAGPRLSNPAGREEWATNFFLRSRKESQRARFHTRLACTFPLPHTTKRQNSILRLQAQRILPCPGLGHLGGNLPISLKPKGFFGITLLVCVWGGGPNRRWAYSWKPII